MGLFWNLTWCVLEKFQNCSLIETHPQREIDRFSIKLHRDLISENIPLHCSSLSSLCVSESLIHTVCTFSCSVL